MNLSLQLGILDSQLGIALVACARAVSLAPQMGRGREIGRRLTVELSYGNWMTTSDFGSVKMFWF